MKRPAIFLDRDGTIIKQVHHLVDAAKVELLPRAAEALRLMADAGYRLVVVTNQSVIGRGMLTEAGLATIHARMNRLLAEQGARVDAIYHCPTAPRGDDRTAVEDPDRKPGPGMLQRAALEMNLDLVRSWMVGDMVSDLLAGQRAGCRGSILVLTGHGQTSPREHASHVCADLLEAAKLINQIDALTPLQTS